MTQDQKIVGTGFPVTNGGTATAKRIPNRMKASEAEVARENRKQKKYTANCAGRRSQGLSPKAATTTRAVSAPPVEPANCRKALRRLVAMSGWFVTKMAAIARIIDGGRRTSPNRRAIEQAAVTRRAPSRRCGLAASSRRSVPAKGFRAVS